MRTPDQELRLQAEEAKKKRQETAASDRYRQNYHVMPSVGLLNDPNGVIQWNGVYHLFFQWQPFHTGHGAKFWAHVTTKDFVEWKEEEIALAPGEWYDKNGCYSGSAIEKDGRLCLMYTGNVRDGEGNRETYQCLAVSEDGIVFDKKESSRVSRKAIPLISVIRRCGRRTGRITWCSARRQKSSPEALCCSRQRT